MTGEVLSVDEQVAAKDYHRVSENAAIEAEGFDLLARAAAALTDPTLQTREDIFIRILEVQGKVPFEAWNHRSEHGLELSLGQAAVLAKTHAESAGRLATDADQTAQHIKQNGLSDTGIE